MMPIMMHTVFASVLEMHRRVVVFKFLLLARGYGVCPPIVKFAVGSITGVLKLMAEQYWDPVTVHSLVCKDKCWMS